MFNEQDPIRPVEQHSEPSPEAATEANPALELPEILVPAAASVAAASVAAAEPKEARPKRSGWKLFAGALALVAMGAGVGSVTTFAMARRFAQVTPIGYTATATPSAKAVTSAPFAESGNVIPGVYRRVSPAVVAIKVQMRQGYSVGQASGSGFVVDSKGYVLTNFHVIKGASKITVNFVDGTKLDGKVVGADQYKDLAIVKVDPGNRGLVAVTLGNSDSVQVGELAIAIGSPFNQDHSVTAGIVSGLNRDINEESNPFPIKGGIQTDAAINPGNSGGPLLNAAGEVIGINTAIESPLRGSVGIGFAVPVNLAKEIIPTLMAGTNVKYPWLGVGLEDMTADIAKTMGSSLTAGAVVYSIYRNSPAAAAGLQSAAVNRQGNILAGDVIIKVDNQPIKGSQDLIEYIKDKKVGDKVKLTVVRGTETLSLTAQLAARPDPGQMTLDGEDQ